MERITVEKITTLELMLKACESTFAGKSAQSLISMYRSEHSPARTQLFWVVCESIPLYVSTHLLRHHVGSQPFALTHRTDRNGGGLDLEELVTEIEFLRMKESEQLKALDFYAADEFTKLIDEKLTIIKEKGGRNTPTTLSMLMNAQGLIDMGKQRLCKKASAHTQKVFKGIKEQVNHVDPALSRMMVAKCVYRFSLCGEHCCGFNNSPAFIDEMKQYLSSFNKKQYNAKIFRGMAED